MYRPRVTVVLLVKNNAEVLEELLTAIFAQEVSFPFEVLAIDSGSWDGSLAILKRLKHRLEAKRRKNARDKNYNDYNSYKNHKINRERFLRIHQIAPIEFGFGKTRNLAARLAKGEITVFLSTRVTPVDRDWLTNLIESISPFTKIAEGTVAAFGKVSPGPKLCFSEAFRLKTFYGRASRILTLGENEVTHPVCQARFQLLFSDLNCAILTCVLRKYPFAENLVGGEEQVWAKTILEKGMAIAYNPHAGVILRRGHTFNEIFSHYFNKGYTFTKGVSVSRFSVFWSWVRFLGHEAVYLIKRQNFKLMVKEFIFELGRLLGYFLGQKADRLPEGVRERLLARSVGNP